LLQAALVDPYGFDHNDALLIEYALPVANLGSVGAMRLRFLTQLGLTRNKFREPVPNVDKLPELHHVLASDPELRATAVKRVEASKRNYAKVMSGAHKLDRVSVGPLETFMQLLRRVNEAQARSGRTPSAQLAGSMPLWLRQAKEAGKFTLAWRAREHHLRHHAGAHPLSYASACSVAVAGAELYIDGLDAELLPRMASRSGATLHDQQDDWVQRHEGAKELVARGGPLFILFDDGSKRKNSYLGTALVGSRRDEARMFEVLDVSILQPDPLDGFQKKTGRNIGRKLVRSLTRYLPDADALWQLHAAMCDSTNPNTGKLIVSGKGGAVAHARAAITKATADESGKNGHILISQVAPPCCTRAASSRAPAVASS
jgi:hypothetical protein